MKNDTEDQRQYILRIRLATIVYRLQKTRGWLAFLTSSQTLHYLTILVTKTDNFNTQFKERRKKATIEFTVGLAVQYPNLSTTQNLDMFGRFWKNSYKNIVFRWI